MSEFPVTIYTPRETENLPGIEYDADQKRFLYSEDFQNLGGEIEAIETFLHPITDFSGQAGKVLKVNDAEDALEFGTGGTGGGAWGEITGTLSDQTDLQDALDAKQDSLGFTAENVADKSTSVSTDHASNTKYPSVKAVYDWALSIFQLALGYTPEDVADKSTNTSLGTSDTLYPSQKAVKTYVDAGLATKQDSLGFTAENVANKSTDVDADKASNTKYPSVKAVHDWCNSSLISQQKYNIFTGLGSNIIAWSLGYTWNDLDTSGAQTSQTVFFQPVYLSSGMVITGVKWYQFTQGVYTASNYNGFGLYSYSAGTLTLVASTSNDGNIFKGTSKTVQNKDFSSQYTVTTSGTYYIACLASRSAQTTNPLLGAAIAFTGSLTFGFDFTNGALLHPTVASQTSLPSPIGMGSLTDATNRYVFGLY